MFALHTAIYTHGPGLRCIWFCYWSGLHAVFSCKYMKQNKFTKQTNDMNIYNLPTFISRRKNQWYIVSQLLLEQNILQAWSQVFLPTKLSVLLKIIFFISLKSTKNHFHQSKIYKNHFENSNFWGMWPLGHVGHVT
jgi:hypothetical protein